MARQYSWWHAAALALGASAIGGLVTANIKGVREYYDSLDTPDVAPPAAAFGPAWTLNNMASSWAGLRIINLPKGTPHRETILALEGFNWAMFPLHAPLFFGLRSPMLGAIHTGTCLSTTAISAILASRVDQKAALALLPRLGWLSLATYLSVFVALENEDNWWRDNVRAVAQELLES